MFFPQKKNPVSYFLWQKMRFMYAKPKMELLREQGNRNRLDVRQSFYEKQLSRSTWNVSKKLSCTRCCIWSVMRWLLAVSMHGEKFHWCNAALSSQFIHPVYKIKIVKSNENKTCGWYISGIFNLVFLIQCRILLMFVKEIRLAYGIYMPAPCYEEQL